VWDRSQHNSTYGISKFRSEREVWRGIAEGLEAAIVNPSVIMGAGQWHAGTPQMFKSVYHGLPAVPTGTTGFVDVRDVANIMIQLMDSDIAGERYILNSESLSYRQLFDQISQALGKQPPRFTVNKWQGMLVAYIDQFASRLVGANPRVQIEYARNFGKAYHYQNDKIKERLGFEFIPISQTIRETGKEFLEKYPANQPGMLSLDGIKVR
jgi:nucleoside-diphosphate-sugar epimerase